MPSFERSSLNTKLMVMSLMSAATALLVVFAAFAVTSVLNHRKDEGMQLSSFAGVIGANSVDALQFNDRALARHTLAALRAKVEISRAALYDRQGQPFASYRAAQVSDGIAVPAAADDAPMGRRNRAPQRRRRGSMPCLWPASTRPTWPRPMSAADKSGRPGCACTSPCTMTPARWAS
jgi:hypothetical protein